MHSFFYALPLLFISAAAYAQDDDDFDPMTVDVLDTINCRIDAPTYNAFALTIDGTDRLWKKRGWQKVKSKNFMMAEYRLPAPIEILTGYKTDHIAFTSSGILAILDLDNPKEIADPQQIQNQADPEQLIAEMVEQGVATRAEIEKDITFKKFLGERIIVDTNEIDSTLNMIFRTTIVRNISNVSSHPGKTLYGCSYRITMDEIPAKK